jgi:hypothetical protein
MQHTKNEQRNGKKKRKKRFRKQTPISRSHFIVVNLLDFSATRNAEASTCVPDENAKGKREQKKKDKKKTKPNKNALLKIEYTPQEEKKTLQEQHGA